MIVFLFIECDVERPGKSLDGRLRLSGFHSARSRAAGGAAGERQQCDIAGALDGDTEPALVTRADTCHTARKNLAAFLHELRKNVGTLVVDEIHLFDTELADFLFAKKLTLAATRAAGSAARTTGTAFTASAATATGTTFATSAATAMSTVPSTRATMPATTRAAFATRRWS
jgi:hypothetical protein